MAGAGLVALDSPALVNRCTGQDSTVERRRQSGEPPVSSVEDFPFRQVCGGISVQSASLRGESYREALDLLSEMSHILGMTDFEAVDLPAYSTLVKWFDRTKTSVWRVFLRLSAQEHEPSGHAAIDATFSTAEPEQALLPSNELPRADLQNDRSGRYRELNDSGRALSDRETPRPRP